jgi:hypothetical protein
MFCIFYISGILQTLTPKAQASSGDILVMDTTHHTEEYHYPRYDEIYKNFNIKDLSS